MVIRPYITHFELGDCREGHSLGGSKASLRVGEVQQKELVMNAVKTVGLPMWRVGMIAWKRRLEKRLINLIRNAQAFSMRLSAWMF